MSLKTKALTEANVELLCSYIKKTYTEASDFIDDNNVKTNGTYSSKKIENIKLELKQYSNDLINNIISIKTEVSDIEPTLDNTIPNTIYLFEIDSVNHIWNQYLRTETLLVNLGTTEIDLTEYVKNTDLASSTQNGLMTKEDFDKLASITVSELVTNTILSTTLTDYKTVNDYNSDKGSVDISSIGDGTFTGAISTLNEKLNNVATVEEIDTLFD